MENTAVNKQSDKKNMAVVSFFGPHCFRYNRIFVSRWRKSWLSDLNDDEFSLPCKPEEAMSYIWLFYFVINHSTHEMKTFFFSLCPTASWFLLLLLYRPLFQICTPSAPSMWWVLHKSRSVLLKTFEHHNNKTIISAVPVCLQLPLVAVPQMAPANPPQQPLLVNSHTDFPWPHFYFSLHCKL